MSTLYTIGFANLSEEQPFCRLVRQSLEAAVALHPNFQLLIRDNAMDNDRALANIQEFAERRVNLCISYHIDERYNTQLWQFLFKAQIPTIAVDIPMPMAIYLGVNNIQAGRLAGQALADWVNQHWEGQVDKALVITESRVLATVRQRLDVAITTLSEKTHFNPNHVMHIDGMNSRDSSYKQSLAILENWSKAKRIAIVGLNDESALGALSAARDLGRESEVVAVGHGANSLAEAFSTPQSRFLGSVAYYPEQYGPRLLDLAQRILNGERVPREHFTEHECITRQNYRP